MTGFLVRKFDDFDKANMKYLVTVAKCSRKDSRKNSGEGRGKANRNDGVTAVYVFSEVAKIAESA